MALPEVSGRKRKASPSAAVAFWRGRSGSPQVHFRLSEAKRPGAAVILRIDERVFQLFSGGSDAWAPERATASIIAAMRTGMVMTIETRTAGGRRMRDRYQLRGAATAIDGAAIACSRTAKAGKKPQ